MSALSLDDKKSYYEKKQRANFLASMRLEGYNVTLSDAERPLPSKSELIERYRKAQV